MPFQTVCPSCGRKLRVPDKLIGQRVKCPGCSTPFTAEEENNAPAADASSTMAPPRAEERRSSAPASDEDERNDRPSKRRREEREEDERPGRNERSEPFEGKPHRGGMILTLGIISVSCGVLELVCGGGGFCCGLVAIGSLVMSIAALGCGIPAWIMGQRDLASMHKGAMDRSGEGSTRGGWICGIIGTCLGGLGLLCSVVAVILFIAGMGASLFTNRMP